MCLNDLLLLVFVFLSIWQGIVLIARFIRKQSISWPTILLLAVGLTGIATHYMGVW